jgi:integrase
VRESATEICSQLVYGTPKTHRAAGDRRKVRGRRRRPCAPTRCCRRPGVHGTASRTLRSSNFRNTVGLPSVIELAEHYPELARLRVHDLRHTAASLAISCGSNVKVVQQMLGHKSASMTLDLYLHLYTQDLEDLAGRLNAQYRVVA